LRAAFGAERELIRTVSGRGYQFTGEIHVVPASPGEAVGAVAAQPASVLPPTYVPEPVSELIGREEEVSEILNLLTTHWLVTVTGVLLQRPRRAIIRPWPPEFRRPFGTAHR
jgi:hypothetical protein